MTALPMILALLAIGCGTPAPSKQPSVVEDSAYIYVEVVDKYEGRSVLGGPLFMVRVRLPGGQIAEGEVDTHIWYQIRIGKDIPLLATKRDGVWRVDGLHDL